MSTYPGGYDPAAFPKPFASAYRAHLQHLKLKGLQPRGCPEFCVNGASVSSSASFPQTGW